MQNEYQTSIPGVVLRFAEERDTALILQLIRELAEYEKMPEEVTATEEVLRDSLFRKKAAETVLAEKDGKPVGFALFFHNFSTFLGRPGIYLEDLFVRPQARGLGIGRTLLAFLARLAEKRGCRRLEWWCLDWNRPSIEFYKRMGAQPMEDWTVYRVAGDALPRLAAKF